MYIAIQGGRGGNNRLRNGAGYGEGAACPNRGMFEKNIMDSFTKTVQ